MKKVKSNIPYLTYYLILGVILGAQVIQTVYSGSLFVHRNHQLQSLTRERQVLVERNYDLTTKLSQKNSLNTLLSSATLNGYSDITNPIVISDKAMVALK